MSAQIKSRDRLRDAGEVFTAQRKVDAMLDLLPAELFQNPDPTFLEPTCGQGVFLTEILRRKLRYCSTYVEVLPSVSLYGIDIADDNVDETKAALLGLATAHLHSICPWLNRWDVHEVASVIGRNAQQGDSLNCEI